MKCLFSWFLILLATFLAAVTNARHLRRAAEITEVQLGEEKRTEQERYAMARVDLEYSWLLPGEDNDILNNATLLIETLNKGHGETPIVIPAQPIQKGIPNLPPAASIAHFDPPESASAPESVAAPVIVDQVPETLSASVPLRPEVVPEKLPIGQTPQVSPPVAKDPEVLPPKPPVPETRFSPLEFFGLSFGGSEPTEIESGVNTTSTTTIKPSEKSDEPQEPDEILEPESPPSLSLPVPSPISIPILNISENATAPHNVVQHQAQEEPQEESTALPESTLPPTEQVPTEPPSGILIENEEEIFGGESTSVPEPEPEPKPKPKPTPAPAIEPILEPESESNNGQEVVDTVEAEVDPTKAPNKDSSEESDESDESSEEKGESPTIPPTEIPTPTPTDAVPEEVEPEKGPELNPTVISEPEPAVDTSVKVVAGRETENAHQDTKERLMFDTIASWFGGSNETTAPVVPPVPAKVPLPETETSGVASPPRDVRDEIPVENKTVTFVPTHADLLELILITALPSNVTQPFPPPPKSKENANSNSTNVVKALQSK